MSTCVESVAPSQNTPERLPTVHQSNFALPLGPSPRTLEPRGVAGLVETRPTLVGTAVANCIHLNLCLHSEGAGFEDVYLTFAGADCQNPDFAEMLHWLQAKISCWRGSSVSMGIGGSKLMAAIASRVALTGRVCVVAPGTEEAFLAPVSVQKLRGVVQIETRALERGVSTLGQLRQIPKPVLINVFGEAAGQALWEAARGRDAKKVGRWKLSSLFSPLSAWGIATGQPEWIHRLFLLMSTKLEALDRVLERILAIPEEEVPPRTTSLP
jgi:hypothetical protein